jgi:hypothetical protein
MNCAKCGQSVSKCECVVFAPGLFVPSVELSVSSEVNDVEMVSMPSLPLHEMVGLGFDVATAGV